ncbi:TPA: hypothetical protein CPT80_05185 [Candidatus Gastranaerophilales bacterium HUM_9]|nr:MAG TPA: hypothetical protein CPT80_05185 [Candidatus Gastranaerophilales bacterium HUM_9]HBX35621.1 hypothetical protein [Cyanobacteria bacterium UBA11440]
MKKLLLSILCIILFQSYGFAISYEDLNTIKEPAYRFGTTDEVENPMDINTTLEKKATMSDSSVEDANLTYADLSIKRISKEISQDLQIDYDEILSDLSMLWQGAATKSDTIKFALYKLANPNEDKPDKNSIKKVLSTIANMSTLIGAGTGNPLLASASLIGGNTLGILSQDTKALNYKYTKVGDADMIILVRKIDELQQKVVGIYYDYMTARELYNMRSEMANRRHYYYTQTQNGSKEMILIADAYYREALDLQKKAKNRFADKRAQLEQIVGPDTFKQFEEMINARDKK